MPTSEQAWRCLLLCANLTRFYQFIFLVRLDERTSNVVILAGNEIEIEIYPNGEWDFTNEQT